MLQQMISRFIARFDSRRRRELSELGITARAIIARCQRYERLFLFIEQNVPSSANDCRLKAINLSLEMAHIRSMQSEVEHKLGRRFSRIEDLVDHGQGFLSMERAIRYWRQFAA